MNISEKIQILRRDKEWSQDELAEKLNVSRQSVSKWESGKALPDSEKILAMANLFDVSTDFLLKDEQEPVFVDDEKEQTKDKTDGALTENTEKKKHKFSGKKIVAIVVVACIVIAAITPLFFGGYSAFLSKISEDPVQYP